MRSISVVEPTVDLLIEHLDTLESKLDDTPRFLELDRHLVVEGGQLFVE